MSGSSDQFRFADLRVFAVAAEDDTFLARRQVLALAVAIEDVEQHELIQLY